jgi:hypothetical protein
MENEVLVQNALSLERELDWLEQVVVVRLADWLKTPTEEPLEWPAAPDLDADPSRYAIMVRHYGMGEAERLLVCLALAPHLRPQLLDPLFFKNKEYERGYTEFGGMLGQQHSGFMPTGETALFLLAGDNLALRLHYMTLFDEGYYLFRHNILKLETPPPREPLSSGALVPDQAFLALFTHPEGKFEPKFGPQFPAQRVETRLDWADLVLDPQTREDVEEIQLWLTHRNTLLADWKLGRSLKRGYRSLFYGPPGTGKSMTAALLGKLTGRDVYRIDLSQVVSKYIGETEKNLAGIFDRAENADWILFFDEADALFGKRSTTKDAKDRYANQEVSFLLQRIEDFSGVVILATNFKNNMDDAFVRRFQSMVYFPMPGPELRLQLWQKAFAPPLPVADDIDWHTIAEEHELAGGVIINVLRTCALAILRGNSPRKVTQEDVLAAIRKERRKEGRGDER